MTKTVSTAPFEVNGRRYEPPARPIAVLCIDGCADEYLDVSLARGRMPRLSRLLSEGAFRGMVRGALPSFTNVNNTAIVSGVPPAVTGVCGNFFLDPESGEAVMMNSPKFRRCDTILNAAADAGRKVAFVTAKEKLRTVLGDGVVERGGIAFSTEKVDEASSETHGIENVEELVGKSRPEIYSADASVYVLDAGARLAETGQADFLYLSTTDFMQHKFGPDAPESLAFYEALDGQIGRLVDSGCVVAATADHGMNAKNGPEGPNVVYLESLLSGEFGPGIRVICPITDPYVAHHGALGSFVQVHVDSPDRIPAIIDYVNRVEGVTEVYDRETMCRRLELAPDRVGDLCVLGGRDVVIGKTPEDHDLSVLDGGLRSHGGRYEEMVPMFFSHRLNAEYAQRAAADPRNFDIFAFVCNGVEI